MGKVINLTESQLNQIIKESFGHGTMLKRARFDGKEPQRAEFEIPVSDNDKTRSIDVGDEHILPNRLNRDSGWNNDYARELHNLKNKKK